MRCPSCGTTEGIKWFLRHQTENKDDDSDLANVITILCTACGKNESYFLDSCLESIFPSWKDADFDFGALAQMFGSKTDFFENENYIEEKDANE